MERSYIDVGTLRTAIVEILEKEKTRAGLYRWIDGQRLRERVRKHLNLHKDQVIRSEDWDEAVALEIKQGAIRRGFHPYPQRLAFLPKA